MDSRAPPPKMRIKIELKLVENVAAEFMFLRVVGTVARTTKITQFFERF